MAMWGSRKKGNGMASRYLLGLLLFILGLFVVIFRGPVLTVACLLFMVTAADKLE
jgi:hypothetical protein